MTVGVTWQCLKLATGVIISTDLNMTFRQKSVKISGYQMLGKFNTIPTARYSGHCGNRLIVYINNAKSCVSH